MKKMCKMQDVITELLTEVVGLKKVFWGTQNDRWVTPDICDNKITTFDWLKKKIPCAC